ncbi:dephospho-CoA kinase [Agrobacterium rosae]|uniref:Dephospho-CoA kinase n=1 Tax=Agrobacterium rosae TaxID=1972867 RepID=A0AAE5VMT4_9HYPH|nr:dephospho-CoA kinase [Agrobacterium rosae]KAA3510587.1 dephospho-CoA kinase [Agrobacterium rosae]KAA3517305.1 dephospho-CoA kinase [Agrobacterium rosae]MCM2434770.1 dephospho-CoA kinase [Agrobacterium rosae]MDX8330312.1 dephospho-CoA kinase [Agrobacterium rosae]MQB50051.1 dephospho-CoA kinase [Agrobacterium rosae]
MITIGLTGSIGMGKSTTAQLFAQEGIAICDSDAVVHQLYENEAASLIEDAFRGTTEAGRVNREKLGQILRQNPANFAKLEQLVHPLVRSKQDEFLERERQNGSAFALLDIPLLFETGAETRVDVIVVVSCAPDIQRQRVLSRPGMSEEKFQMILARQRPDEEKRKRADFIIDTGRGLEDARVQVQAVLVALRTRRDGKV